MIHLLLFVLTYIIVLVIYEIFIVRKAKKDKSKKPIEVKYLVNKHKVNMRKADYNQMLQIVALTSSFDISLVVLIVSFFERINIQIIVAALCILPIIIGSYYLVSRFYKKKGMIKDE